MRPIVSVILPTYNRAETLKRSIDSVLGQTFRDFELIIIDDGSTDETSRILRWWSAHPQIRVFSQPHGGCAKARNSGLTKSRGAYIAFQDSDDEWLPHKLEKSVDTLESAGPHVGVFYSDMLHIKDDLSSVYFRSPDIKPGCLIGERLDYQTFAIGMVSTLTRRECFDTAGWFDESLYRFTDLELLIRLSDLFAFIHCKEPLVKYYYSPDAMSLDREALVSARQYLMEKYRARLETSGHLWVQNLYLTIAKADVEIARLSSELANTRAALEGVKSARSWQLLQRYGRIRTYLSHMARRANSNSDQS